MRVPAMREVFHRTVQRFGLLSWVFALASPAVATLHVDQNDPACSDVTGTPYCEVQAALLDAVSGETIFVASGLYAVNFELNRELKLVGAGAEATLLTGSDLDRVFQLSPGADLQLIDVTVLNGNAADTGGCFNLSPGAVLRLDSCVVRSCTAATTGGAIYGPPGSEVEIVRSTLSTNWAGSGGGMWIASSVATPSTLRLVDSLVWDNVATGNGGGLGLSGHLEITNVTVSGNFAMAHGGGLYLSSPSEGVLAHLTVTNNWADVDSAGGGLGGGIRIDGNVSAVIRTSIVSGNSIGSTGNAPDCNGTFPSGGYNLVGDLAFCTMAGDTTGNLYAVLDGLLPLAENGGPTRTHALASGSYALDAGDPAGCLDAAGALRDHDQRGFPSPEEGDDGLPAIACDMGAFEVSSAIFVDGFESSTTSNWSAAVF